MRITKSRKGSSSSIQASYRMPPNPYDIGPPDPPEPNYLDAYDAELTVEFNEPITIYEDGEVELTGDSWGLDPAPDNFGYYYDEDNGAQILSGDDIYQWLYDELNDKNLLEGYGPGNYVITGTIDIKLSVSGVEYDEEYDGPDEDGDPIVDTTYYTDNAESELVSFTVSNLNVTEAAGEQVTSGTDIVVAADDIGWQELRTKQVLDSDGFTTDYTLYVNDDGSQYICMFGDRDVYEPDPNYADWEGSSQEEAYEWFDSYDSEYDEDDDIYGADAVDSNEVTLAGERNYDGSHAFLLQSPVFDDYSYINKMRELLPNRIDSTGYSNEIAVFAKPDEKQAILDAIAAFNQSVLCATDANSADNYEDDIQEIGQEFTSENTSINSGRLPAVFNMVSFEPGTVNIDYGGGRFDNVAEYLTQYDVVNLVYDPYNRTAEHNKEVIRLIREHGGADTATCSNVLNVIKEPEVRLNVLNNIKKLVKSGGIVYITVYEGKGNAAEGPTKSGYQLNRKTADYMEEVQQVFPDATRKGKLIVATNTSSVNSATDYDIDADYQRIDRNGSDHEYEIAALSYMYGLSLEDAEQQYDTFTDVEIQNAIQYYNLRGLPQSERLKCYKPVTSATEGGIDVDAVLEQLDEEARDIVFEALQGPNFGFDVEEIPDVCHIEVTQNDHTYAKIEVRAEVSYEGLETLMSALTDWISYYDTDAYFDAEDVGITNAFVNMRKVSAMGGDILSCDTVDAVDNPDDIVCL